MKKKVVIHDGFAPYLTLHYFKRRRDMMAAHNREVPGDKLGNDCMGAFCGITLAIDYSGKEEARNWTIGDLWLCEDSLDVETLAHECLHAAQVFERVVHGFDLNYGRGGGHINGHEERLAYLLTDIIRAVTLALRPKIVYSVQIREKTKSVMEALKRMGLQTREKVKK